MANGRESDAGIQAKTSMKPTDLFQRYQNAIVIGKEESRAFFAGLKKDMSTLDVTFYSVDEIIDMFSYSYDETAISYLRSEYEFDPLIAEEALLIVSLMNQNHYSSRRLHSLVPLRDDLLKHGLLHEPREDLGKIFEKHNILYFGLNTALPLSLRLGELHNMALSFDLPIEGRYHVDPDIEKYRKLSSEEKKELGLYL